MIFRSALSSRPSVTRIQVERIRLGQVVGWVASPDSAALQTLRWLVDGQPQAAALQWQVREDVVASTGMPARGFAMDLPADTWVKAAGGARFALAAGDAQLAVAALPSLADWLTEQRAACLAVADDGRAWFAAADAPHVRRLAAAALSATECAAWTQADRVWLAAQSATLSPPASGPLLGWLEGCSGLRLRGWAWRCGAATPALRLVAGGAVLTTPVGWVSRADAWANVQLVDPSAPPAIGFDVPIPARAWLHAHEGALVLRVGGDGAVLGGEPVRLTAADLLTLWQHAADDTSTVSDDDLLLLLEHSAAANAWPAADSVLAAFVRRQAEHLGAAHRLAPALQAPARHWAPPASWTTQAVWQLLRELNGAVAVDGANASDAISQLLTDPRCDGEVKQWFLRSILPYACVHGALQTVLAHIDLPALRTSADSTDAWALSVGLPVWAQLGAWDQVLTLLERLAPRPGGWLNTEAIHAATALALASPPTAPPPAYWTALVSLLETEAAVVTGRAHDRHLLDTLALVVMSADRLPAQAHAAAIDCVWRHHRFNPDWWRALARLQHDTSLWPLGLAQAHTHLNIVRAFLLDCAAADTGSGSSVGIQATLWQVLALIGQPVPGPWSTANQLVTECIQAAWPHMQDADTTSRQRLATWAGAGEWLRFAQHPATRTLSPPADAPMLLAAATSTLPCTPAIMARRQAVALFARAEKGDTPLPDPTVDEWRALTSPDNQGVALRLSAWALWRATVACDTHAVARWTGALVATRSQLGDGARSAPALREAGVWLARARAANSQNHALAQLAHEWGCGDPPAANFTAMHQLVVCVACEASRAASTQERIAASWGKALDEHGIPWRVVTAVTAEGADAVHAMTATPSTSGTDPVAPTLSSGMPDNQGAVQRAHLRAPHWAPSGGAFWVALAAWAATTWGEAHLLCIGADQSLAVDRLLAGVAYWGCDALALPQPLHAEGTAQGGLDALDWRCGVVLSAHGTMALSAQAASKCALTSDAFCSGDVWLARWLRDARVPVSHQGWLPRRQEPISLTLTRALAPAVLPEMAVTYPHEPRQPVAGTDTRGWIWPTWRAARMGSDTDHPLQLLRVADPATQPAAAEPLITVVGVLRDERVLLPHFLSHYRALGVRHFVLADNGSNDSSVPWLLAQDDVTLYHVASQYRHSHYGVLWQQAMLAAHCQHQWALLADLDEFALLPCDANGARDHRRLGQWLAAELRTRPTANAVLFQMVDRYPDGDLVQADFALGDPFALATKQDEPPCLPWHLGSGAYSNSFSWVSAMRHRLLPGSSPTDYTSQKVALVRYAPWTRFAEGLHYASNVQFTNSSLTFAHFKYHKGFQDKVEREIARGQHFNAAQEYRNYQYMRL